MATPVDHTHAPKGIVETLPLVSTWRLFLSTDDTLLFSTSWIPVLQMHDQIHGLSMPQNWIVEICEVSSDCKDDSRQGKAEAVSFKCPCMSLCNIAKKTSDHYHHGISRLSAHNLDKHEKCSQ